MGQLLAWDCSTGGLEPANPLQSSLIHPYYRLRLVGKKEAQIEQKCQSMPLIHLFPIQILNLVEIGLSLSLSFQCDSNPTCTQHLLLSLGLTWSLKRKRYVLALGEVGSEWVGGLRKSGSISRPENPSNSSFCLKSEFRSFLYREH